VLTPGYHQAMGTRKIISIDHDRCNGCGKCIPNCPEGALQIIDGKARLISDLFCDGLGACIGHCPEGAIEMVEREAEPYDERRVMAGIAPQGANTIRAHLKHLHDHGESRLLSQAIEYLEENGIAAPDGIGSPAPGPQKSSLTSQLVNWPIQFHLLSPSFSSAGWKGRAAQRRLRGPCGPRFPGEVPEGESPRHCLPQARRGKGCLSGQDHGDGRHGAHQHAHRRNDGGAMLPWSAGHCTGCPLPLQIARFPSRP